MNDINYVPYRSSEPISNFDVSPEEGKSLKKQYFSTFLRIIIHSASSFITAQIVFTLMSMMGYVFRYTDDNIAIIDWQYSLAASLPSIFFCLFIFLGDVMSKEVKVSSCFRTDRITGKMFIGFFGMIMLAYAVSMFLQSFIIEGMFALGISPISEDMLTESDITDKYLITELITTVILAPVAEELMYRGVVLRRLSAVSQRFAIFVSAAMFGLMHGNLLQAVMGFIVGIVLGYAAVKTGSLVLPVLGHIFVNGFAASSVFIEYFLGEDMSTSLWTLGIILFLVIGVIALIAVVALRSVQFPEYNEYHRKRCFPIMLRCISFWVVTVMFIAEIVMVMGEATEKLME